MSIDHVVPRSKGGTHDAGNLRWVLTLANVAKDAMSDDVFFDLCQAIVDHRRA